MTCIDTALGTFQLRVFEPTLPGRTLRFFVGHHSLCLREITVCVWQDGLPSPHLHTETNGGREGPSVRLDCRQAMYIIRTRINESVGYWSSWFNLQTHLFLLREWLFYILKIKLSPPPWEGTCCLGTPLHRVEGMFWVGNGYYTDKTYSWALSSVRSLRNMFGQHNLLQLLVCLHIAVLLPVNSQINEQGFLKVGLVNFARQAVYLLA